MLEGQSARLSAAALETLAIVAYKQPISRAQVAAIRGVNVDGVMRTLQQRGYIDEVGRDPGPGPGRRCSARPTCSSRRSGSTRSTSCPPLADFVPGADVVEVLEHGLRVEADQAHESATDDGAADDGASDEAASDERETDDGATASGDEVTVDIDRPGAARPRRRGRLTVVEPIPDGATGDAYDPSIEGERLQKVLARAGIGSRRVCEDLIAEGRVTVNGETAILGAGSTPTTTWSRSTGSPIGVRPGLVYYLLNKPTGVVTTADDPQGRPTVVVARARRAPGASRSADSTSTPRACCCSPTTASSPTGSPTRASASRRSTSPRSRATRREARCDASARASSSTTASPHRRRRRARLPAWCAS